MNNIHATLLFSILSILIYAFIYYKTSPIYVYKYNRKTNTADKLSILDSLYYSTTVQSTIGLPTDIVMSDGPGRMLVLSQHFVVISTAAIIISHFYHTLTI